MNAQGFSSNETSQLPTQNFAFVFGGLGAYAKLEAFKCLLAVESLVKVGGYKGDVYFITEPKACVPTQIELRTLLNYDKVYVLSKDDESKLSGESSFSNRRIKKKKKKDFDISQRHVGKNGYFSISTRENPNCGVVRLRRGFWSAGLREKQFIVRYSRVFIESADV